MHRIALLCFALLVCCGSPTTITAEDSAPQPITPERIQQQLDDDFGVDEIAASSAFAESLGLADWLGPLAPVALSPFFGVMCLSGLALWGPDWVLENSLLSQAGPLRSQVIFFIFLSLTLVTSVPRLTKVSKPFAQAMDQLETYAVIVILLVLKLMPSIEAGGEPELAMVQLGVFSVTADTLLAVAMVVNVLVINSVKFFFEFLIWLTPVPLIDAVFEIGNKTVCAALMAIYAFSPTVATVINLLILLVAALIFRWVNRRVRFYRTMILDPVLSQLWPGFGRATKEELIVFPKSDFGPFAEKSRLRLTCAGDQGWTLSEANWWLPAKRHQLSVAAQPCVYRGWVMNRVEIGDDVFLFSRRYRADALARLAQQMRLSIPPAHADSQHVDLAGQFA